jgi:hypothetical protein
MNCIFNVVLLALIACAGCANPNPDQCVYLDEIKIPLLKPSRSTPASINFDAEVSGPITVADKNRICCLIGRVPNISHEIEAIHATSSNNIISAKIWVHRYELDAEKSISGGWNITHFERCIF